MTIGEPSNIGYSFDKYIKEMMVFSDLMSGDYDFKAKPCSSV